jgi:hypothetical protein
MPPNTACTRRVEIAAFSGVFQVEAGSIKAA